MAPVAQWMERLFPKRKAVGDVPVDSEAPVVTLSISRIDASDDFVNLQELSAQSSKMLIGVGFACVRS
uniref:Uncharacterized protein n=1 Tax=Oryza meridionalis TaxID=40149 RepID=A0A0E0C521_9ORYZ